MAREAQLGRSQLSTGEYRTLVEHALMMVWRSGLDGKCDYFNHTWLAFTGRALWEELGDGWATGVHPDDLDGCLEIYRAHFARREPFEMEYRLRRHDGAYCYILDCGDPFFDERGRFAGFIGSCIDIDQRRRADRDRAIFLSMMAHEMRSPLTSVRLSVAMLARGSSAGQPIDPALLARIESQIDRMIRLTADLGETGRIEEGRGLSLEVESVDLAGVARRMVTLLAGGRRIALELPDGPCRVDGDTARLEQVLTNLIENALKYSPPDSPIIVRLATLESEHRLSVSDTGIGINAEDLPLVSRKYFRARNARSSAGNGLGLAIGREILEAHRGRLEIASTVGRGTTVTMVLPRSPSW